MLARLQGVMLLTSLCLCCHVQVAPPEVNTEAPLQLLCANIDYDEHKGRIAIGRVTNGTIRKGQQVRDDCCWLLSG